MTQLQQVKQLAELGVDYAGFIFYENSPRYVVGKIQPGELKSLHAEILKVGVFVNETEDKILKIAAAYGLDFVQLHGDETPDFCRNISAHIKIIKAFRLQGDEDVIALMKDYTEAADLFLFDTKAKDYGGTGKKFNWDILQQTSLNKPYFLSGGISYTDVDLLNDFIKNSIYNDLYALDINSKFETEPGVKDINLVTRFVDEIRRKFIK